MGRRSGEVGGGGGEEEGRRRGGGGEEVGGGRGGDEEGTRRRRVSRTDSDSWIHRPDKRFTLLQATAPLVQH